MCPTVRSNGQKVKMSENCDVHEGLIHSSPDLSQFMHQAYQQLHQHTSVILRSSRPTEALSFMRPGNIRNFVDDALMHQEYRQWHQRTSDDGEYLCPSKPSSDTLPASDVSPSLSPLSQLASSSVSRSSRSTVCRMISKTLAAKGTCTNEIVSTKAKVTCFQHQIFEIRSEA